MPYYVDTIVWYDTKNHGLNDRMLSCDCGAVICSLICDALNFVLMKLLQFCLKLWLLTREFCLLSYYMSLSFPDSAWLFICTLFPMCCDWFTPLALLIMLHLCLTFSCTESPCMSKKWVLIRFFSFFFMNKNNSHCQTYGCSYLYLDVFSCYSWYTTMVFCSFHIIELRCRPCK